MLDESAKLGRLLKMLAPWCVEGRGPTLPKALVFANTKAGVARLCGKLQQAGAAADCLHGERDQRVRGSVLAAFAAGRLNLLVATDVNPPPPPPPLSHTHAAPSARPSLPVCR